MITTYSEAISFLHNRTNFEQNSATSFQHSDFKLERMRRLLFELGNPHQIPAVHIAGTKGKGSTAQMIAVCAQAAKIRTGLFTSPHLERYEERIQIDGELLESTLLISQVALLEKATEKIAHDDSSFIPTFFELTTALAWLCFRELKVDLAIMEVGLGGRLDSTNLCNPVVTAITSIGIDHTQQLGDTISKIAAEKAGIIKKGVPLVSGCQHQDAMNIIRQKCQTLGAELWELDHQIQYQTSSLSRHCIKHITTPAKSHTKLPLPVLGQHQARNLATAIGVIDCLDKCGFSISSSDIVDGLNRVQLPGRQELFSTTPPTLLDVAHNADSNFALIQTLGNFSEVTGTRVLVYGSVRDKNYVDQLKALKPHFDRIVLCAAKSSDRSCDPEDILRHCGWEEDASLRVSKSSVSAYESARQQAGEEGLVVISGSFYLAGELRPHCQEGAQKKTINHSHATSRPESFSLPGPPTGTTGS